MNAPTERLNPLLDFSGLPRFPEITPAHVAPAIDTLLAAQVSQMSELVASATGDA